jgi:K+/H+ antiporter YhaU regulatory subunit KhtT
MPANASRRLREPRSVESLPSASDRISGGDTLIVLGTREQVARLERLIRGEEIKGE